MEIPASNDKEIEEKLVMFEKHAFVLLSAQEQWENERKIKLDRLIKVEKVLCLWGKKNFEICRTDR